MNLLAKEPEVSISSIAGVVRVSADDDTERKAIQRALKSLENKDLIAPRGSGRSRVYVRSEHALAIQNVDPAPETSPAQGGDDSSRGIELSAAFSIER